MSLFQLEIEMRITRNKLRRTIRRVLSESVHSHLDGELTNVVFAASQEVAEEYGDITVQDVMERIQAMTPEQLGQMIEPEYAEYFASSAIEMTYEDIVDRMYQLVNLGELQGGYEDFFELAQ